MLPAMPDSTSQSAPAEKKDDPRFDVEYLRSHSRALLKASPHIVAGALATERRKTFTVDEAKSLVADYRKRRVPQEG